VLLLQVPELIETTASLTVLGAMRVVAHHMSAVSDGFRWFLTPQNMKPTFFTCQLGAK